MPLTPYGDTSGTHLMVYIPKITDIANIQEGLKRFYYGSENGDVGAATEADIVSNSIAGQFRDLNNNKLNKASPVATTSLTIDSTTGLSPTFALKTTGGTVNFTVPSPSGISAVTLPTTGTVITDAIGVLNSLSTIGNNAGSITLGGTSTTAFNIGHTTSNAKTINIGNGGSLANSITIGTAQSTLSTKGTLTHTGNATFPQLTISGTTGLSLSNTSTVVKNGTNVQIVTDDIDPAVDLNIGSLFIKKGAAWDSALWVKSTAGTGVDKWRKIRGNKWFTGNGAPGTLSGQQIGDFYLDRNTGKVYELA